MVKLGTFISHLAEKDKALCNLFYKKTNKKKTIGSGLNQHCPLLLCWPCEMQIMTPKCHLMHIKRDVGRKMEMSGLCIMLPNTTEQRWKKKLWDSHGPVRGSGISSEGSIFCIQVDPKISHQLTWGTNTESCTTENPAFQNQTDALLIFNQACP